jgi:hypothetical protein
MKNLLESSISKLTAPYTQAQKDTIKPMLDEVVTAILKKAETIRAACEDDKSALKLAVVDGLYKDEPKKRQAAMMIVNNI